MGENEVASLPRRRRRREFAGNEEEGGLEASPGRGFAGVPTVKCGAVSGKPVTGPIFSVLAGDMTTIIPVNPQPPPKCPSMRKSGKKTQVSFWITCI